MLNSPMTPVVPFGSRKPDGVFRNHGVSSMELGSNPVRFKLSRLRYKSDSVLLVSVPEKLTMAPGAPCNSTGCKTIEKRSAEAGRQHGPSHKMTVRNIIFMESSDFLRVV